MSESLYRKYRPQVFSDVVGQDHIIKTLQNSIEANKVSHAYLFCGPRGTGKTTTARILAKALLCEHGPTVSPDGTCEDCQMIAKSVHPDVSELDAASRTGVENVRDEIISRVGYAPVRGNYKVYVIDEVHMLSNAAFNALLKTLEEPPSHIVFVLCTTDPQKVPETIRSRCQRFDFRAINTEELTGRLGAVCEMENVPFEGEALELIARRSNGGLRDALTALEQTIAFGDNNVTLAVVQDMFGKTDTNDLNELICALAKKNLNKCLEFVDAKVNDGVDFAQFADDFAQRLRDVYVMKLTNCDVSVSASDADLKQIKEEAELFDEATLSYTLSIMRDVVRDLRTANNQRLVFELGVFKMLDAHSSMTFEAIDARLTALENGAPVVPSTPAPAPIAPAPQPQSQTVPAKAVPQQVSHAPTPATASATNEAAPKPATYNSKPKEKPVPSAPAPTATPAGKIDFRSIWKTALEDLRNVNPAIYSLLESAHGKFNQAEKIITLNMEEGRKFAFNNLNKPASKTAIIASLEKAGLVGATVKVVMVEGETPSEPEVATPASAPASIPEPVPVATYAPAPAPAPEPDYAEPPEPVPVAAPAPAPASELTPQPESNVDVAQQPNFTEGETEKSEIDEFNDILSSTFGEGAEFKEVN